MPVISYLRGPPWVLLTQRDVIGEIIGSLSGE
ncbi:protein of unknown function [Hyphomicrobium sp. MC1]|nr:protein of unknown function [Hyphomicrobium sp. MC1]